MRWVGWVVGSADGLGVGVLGLVLGGWVVGWLGGWVVGWLGGEHHGVRSFRFCASFRFLGRDVFRC